MNSRQGIGATCALGWVWGSAVAVLGLAAVVAALYASAEPWWAAHVENGPIEFVQLGTWTLALSLTALAAVRGPTRMDRVGAGWLHLIAWLATMRELDMHLLPSPEHLGAWGMHFRTRWWLDFDVPLAPKLLWGMIGLALLAAIVAPVWMYGGRGLRLLWRGDASAVMMIATMGLCFGGFTADDLLRDVKFIDEEPRRAVEEFVELLGAAAYAGVGIAIFKMPPSVREARGGGGERGVG